YIVARELLDMEPLWAALASAAVLAASITVAISGLLRASLRPFGMVWQAIWHVSPGKSDVPQPKLDKLGTGRELVTTLVRQIYDFAGSQPLSSGTQAADASLPAADNGSLLESVPLPIFVLDKDWSIKATNTSAC